MCDCGNEKSVNLINIYLTMADYKKNSKAKGVINSANGSKHVDFREDLSQEQLAYAYEVLKMTDFIDKTYKSNEKDTIKKAKAKPSKKKDSEEK
ncbi:MAG: hypothetical protein Unbinned8210contig1002_18 [Prokaryotic dsDNA virus sp.]|nr:MAG: hypothetical protein Unbinned8210contig1002_18 [Prokaryotic dsDNA virus sp.]|tara:strand:+ start:18842 stop:19123 length:282 start_codon:yes stop_codon:yes gene_type:complete